MSTHIHANAITLAIAPDASPLERRAVEIICARLADRCALPVEVVTTVPAAAAGTLTIIASVADTAPAAAESYRLTIRADGLVTVAGHDAHGVLYGLGYLLRLMTFRGNTVMLPVIEEAHTPATRDRGVYFATHFQNYYERAPLELLTHYIEELALWGCNVLSFWFDMHWYPADFWEDAGSDGHRLLLRLRHIATVARACGMRVGVMGVPNEGFSFQPPAALRADEGARRGAFYVETQICPSQPEGLAMCLDNHRRVQRLLAPLDFFVYWPYDPGGCGCAQCKGAGGWGAIFLALGPTFAELIRTEHPGAEFIVSTWYMDDGERQQVYNMCAQGAEWLDGIITETKDATEATIPPRYRRLVFPEISMFDSYFASYGCNGANPAPIRMAAQARETVEAGCGTLLYSEGLYEDVNKVVWLATLWNPTYTPEEVIGAYSHYYFGAEAAPAMAGYILALEHTWGAGKLLQADAAHVDRLATSLQALGIGLPTADWCRERWQTLRDRAVMDGLMKRIGPDTDLLTETRQLLEAAGAVDDPQTLRPAVARLTAVLEERDALMDTLFEEHWAYLQRLSTARTPLIFLPDSVVGGRDWRPLLATCRQALACGEAEPFRTTLLRGLKRWYWCNNIDWSCFFV